MRNLFIVILLMLPLTQALAAKEPRSGHLDPRIKQLEFREGQVYKIHAHYMQDSMVVFHEDEKIVHLGSGDPIAWQLVPVNNYLSVKPIEDKADTNLNVLTKNSVTGKVRAYAFELNAGETKHIKDKSATFMLKFAYPEDELKKRMLALAETTKVVNTEVIINRKTSADEWNLEYTFAGDTSLVPVRTFDDGEFTYFQFAERMDTPAIFLVNNDGSESLINFHVSGKFVVVQRIGQQFILRDGNKATCIFNENFDGRGQGTVMKMNKAVMASSSDDEED